MNADARGAIDPGGPRAFALRGPERRGQSTGDGGIGLSPLGGIPVPTVRPDWATGTGRQSRSGRESGPDPSGYAALIEPRTTRPRHPHAQVSRFVEPIRNSHASQRFPALRDPREEPGHQARPAPAVRLSLGEDTAGSPSRVPGQEAGERKSRPISRILSGPRGPDGHPSGAVVADDLGAVYPRTRAGRPRTSAREPEGSLFDLAPGGVYLAGRITPTAGGLLHHRFTLTTASGGGLLSVALSRGSPRVGVTDHPALWSPDFPRTRVRRGPATVWPTPPRGSVY